MRQCGCLSRCIRVPSDTHSSLPPCSSMMSLARASPSPRRFLAPSPSPSSARTSSGTTLPKGFSISRSFSGSGPGPCVRNETMKMLGIISESGARSSSVGSCWLAAPKPVDTNDNMRLIVEPALPTERSECSAEDSNFCEAWRCVCLDGRRPSDDGAESDVETSDNSLIRPNCRRGFSSRLRHSS